MAEPAACEACLRRTWLLGELAPMIEKATDDAPGRRTAELLALPDRELALAVARRRASELLDRAGAASAAAMQESVERAGAWACCRHDRLYPRALAGDAQAPAALLGRGDPSGLEALGPDATVTVVGSRRPSGYGRELARMLAGELAGAGLAVVSGMAMGIDSEAHRGALAGGGLTAAVLGCGPDVAYPRRERRLYDEIVERGLVLSELPPGTAAWRWSFPARNRIMAALGRITIVVEAARGSGSLITATMASDLGREVGAVPGRVASSLAEGTNGLIADGAALVRGGQDVIDALAAAGVRRLGKAAPRSREAELDPQLAAVLELVEGGCETADAVARQGRIEAGEAAAGLARLELLGRVRSDLAGRFRPAAGADT